MTVDELKSECRRIERVILIIPRLPRRNSKRLTLFRRGGPVGSVLRIQQDTGKSVVEYRSGEVLESLAKLESNIAKAKD